MLKNEKNSTNVFKQIFIDHWENFKRQYPWYDTEHINDLVSKMLNCGNPKYMGYAEYRCTNCGQGSKVVSLSCKGYLCLSCGKVHTDKWVEQVCNSLIHGMCYRHIVLTMPTLLCEICRRNKILLDYLPRYGAECLKKFYNSIKRKLLKSGFIVVLQTHGRNGSYNVHLHVIATSGGLDDENKWHEIKYFPYEELHRLWQRYLLKMLSDVLGNKAKVHIESFNEQYPNGFVANIDTKNHLSGYEVLATYLAKYVVAPPISLRRILSYNGSKVEYIYKSHRTERMELEKVYAFDFIERMLQHIMPSDFKRIRYYGLHLPAKLKKLRKTVENAIRRTGRIIKNTVKVIFSPNYRYRVKGSTGIDPMICPYCQAEMELWIMYHPKYGIFYEGYDDYNEDLESLKFEIEKINNLEMECCNVEQMLLPF